jgi:hypothetical protein
MQAWETAIQSALKKKNPVGDDATGLELFGCLRFRAMR